MVTAFIARQLVDSFTINLIMIMQMIGSLYFHCNKLFFL